MQRAEEEELVACRGPFDASEGIFDESQQRCRGNANKQSQCCSALRLFQGQEHATSKQARKVPWAIDNYPLPSIDERGACGERHAKTPNIHREVSGTNMCARTVLFVSFSFM